MEIVFFIVPPTVTRVWVQGGATPEDDDIVTLKCTAEPGNPADTLFTWFKGDDPFDGITNDGKVTFDVSAKDDGANFTCQAMNGIGKASRGSVILEVNSKFGLIGKCFSSSSLGDNEQPN